MSDLQKRLRSCGVIPESLGREAADALDAQAVEIARLTQERDAIAVTSKACARACDELGEETVALRARVEAAAKAIEELCRGYVRTLECGRDAIIAAGGDCDPVAVMAARDPHLRAASMAGLGVTDRPSFAEALQHELTADGAPMGMMTWETFRHIVKRARAASGE